MSIAKIARLFLPVAAATLWFIVPLPSRAAGMKAEDVVAKHLDSLGTAQVRAAVKARVAQGTAQYKILVGGAGELDGKAVMVSQERKLQFMMKFPNNLYRGEQFIFDGDKVQVTASTAQQTRSSFGQFVYVQDTILREGLLGGELSTAWPLLSLDSHKPKLSYEGLKRIDGKELHDLRYRPKKSTDAEIHLYFDPETFHHVLTVYTISIRTQLGHEDAQLSNASPIGGDLGPAPSPAGGVVTETSETATARQQETRYRLEEKFSDFRTVDGLTLPNHYTIHFSQELGNGRTTVSDWDITENQIDNPPSVDARNFQVK